MTRMRPRSSDSAMYTLSAFRRRLHARQGARDVVMEAGHAYWLPAQTHAGENTGTTPTHVLFVELKDGPTTGPAHRGGISHSEDAPASGRVLVVAGPHLDPLLVRQLASGRTDLGELAEVLLPGRAGREQDKHPGGHTALVGERVNPALRDVEEIALHRVDPGFPVEEPDGALDDVEGLGEGLVEVRVGAAARPGHVPLEQAILAVGRRARRGKHDVRTGRVRH